MIEDFLQLFDVSPLLRQVVVAMVAGGLIGIEREKQGQKFAGLRTLTILAGIGPPVVFYARVADTPWPVLLYLGLTAVIALYIGHVRFKVQGSDVGFTTSVTVFLVGTLGVLVGYDHLVVAIAMALITTVLLAEKRQLHGYVDKLTYEELTDALKFGALVVVLYPILPTEPVGPFGAIDLREVLIFAVFVLLVEFAAYVSMRQFGGTRGLQVTGVLGGSANSLATAGVMARIPNRSPDALESAAAGLLLAAGSMMVRNVAIAAVVAFPIVAAVWRPVGVMLAIVLGAATYWWYRGRDGDHYEVDFESPLSFAAAGKFAAFYAAIAVASAAAAETVGETGLYVTALAGGLVSSAAVAVTAGSVLHEGAVSVDTAGGMVVLGIAASLVSKIVLIVAANRELRFGTALPMGVAGVVGTIVLLVF